MLKKKQSLSLLVLLVALASGGTPPLSEITLIPVIDYGRSAQQPKSDYSSDLSGNQVVKFAFFYQRFLGISEDKIINYYRDKSTSINRDRLEKGYKLVEVESKFDFPNGDFKSKAIYLIDSAKNVSDTFCLKKIQHYLTYTLQASHFRR